MILHLLTVASWSVFHFHDVAYVVFAEEGSISSAARRTAPLAGRDLGHCSRKSFSRVKSTLMCREALQMAEE